jgi:hypothetical protein
MVQPKARRSLPAPGASWTEPHPRYLFLKSSKAMDWFLHQFCLPGPQAHHCDASIVQASIANAPGEPLNRDLC